jgi:hypothetical protein
MYINVKKKKKKKIISVAFPVDWLTDFWCLTPLSAIFQLYHGDQF